MGKMGAAHAAILSALPEADLVGLCDLDRRAQGVVRGLGLEAPFYTSLDALLDSARPDAAFLCLPSSANLGAATECARRGLHLFVEKPLANTLANARAMLGLLQPGAARCFAVGFMGASIATFRRAKELVASGMIGEVREVAGVVEQTLVSSPQKQWLFNKQAAGGGAGISIGSHCLLQMLRLAGPVESVERAELSRTSGNEVEDTGAAELHFASGATGCLRFDWGAEDRPAMAVAVEVAGSAGRLRVSESILELEAAGECERTHISQLPDAAAFYLGGDGYAREDEEFVHAALNGEEPPVGWPEAFEVQRVIDAVYRASESGERAVPA
jgi:predicted dehydrogenase